MKIALTHIGRSLMGGDNQVGRYIGSKPCLKPYED